MSVYLVTWDINKAKPNYTDARAKFIARLDKYDRIKDQSLDSVVFISTTSTAKQVSDDLKIVLDTNDSLIVTKIVPGNYYGWLQGETWNWIAAKL